LRHYWALEELHRGEFTLLVHHHLVEIKASSCILRPLQGRRTFEVKADVVVLVTPNEPLRGLYDELHAAGLPAKLIGDALAPRDLLMAISDGHWAARQV
jgi:hypothetical protein